VAPHDAAALDYSRGAALLGQEEADAVAAVVASRSLFRYQGGHETGAVARALTTS